MHALLLLIRDSDYSTSSPSPPPPGSSVTIDLQPIGPTASQISTISCSFSTAAIPPTWWRGCGPSSSPFEGRVSNPHILTSFVYVRPPSLQSTASPHLKIIKTVQGIHECSQNCERKLSKSSYKTVFTVKVLKMCVCAMCNWMCHTRSCEEKAFVRFNLEY